MGKNIMGFQIQPNAPQVTVQGRTFAVGAFTWSSVMGEYFKIGVYEISPVDGWVEIQSIGMYAAVDLLKSVQTGGGVANFIKWVIEKVNAFFRSLFVRIVIPIGEPITEADAKAVVSASVNGLNFTVVDGVPILK